MKINVFFGKEIKNASWLVGGKILQMIISFFVSILTARYLGPNNYGLINYAGAYIAFFTSICTLGINSVIIKEFFDFPESQGETIGTSIFMRFLSSILSAITIIATVMVVDADEPTTIIVVVLSSIALLFQVFDTFNYWFQSLYQSKVTAIATLIAYIVTTIYRIILLWRGANVKWFAFASSVDYIVLAVVLSSAYKHKNGPRLSVSLARGKYIISKSYHYILSGMMVAIYAQTDKIMLKQMLDESSVGFYSLASSLNHMWVFVLAAVIDSMYPTILKLYNKDSEAFKRKNKQLYAVVIYLSAFVALCFVLFGKYIILILYGEEYLPAASPLKIITWYTVFSYLGVARNAWMVCTNNQKYLKYICLSAAIINVFLNLILIPFMGAAGAALASLITEICTSIVVPCFIPKMRENVKLMAEAALLRGLK